MRDGLLWVWKGEFGDLGFWGGGFFSLLGGNNEGAGVLTADCVDFVEI